MKRCGSCGTENLDSARYCDECGALLEKTLARRDESNPAIASQTSAAAWAVESGSRSFINRSLSRTDFPRSISSEMKASDLPAVLTIERGKSAGKQFFLHDAETQIGRWDADNSVFPDVDLDAHDPEAKVSRRHAKIIREGANFLIEDLNSTNGTFINRGRRLLPGDRLILNDEDEIIVGKTFLRFKIIR